MLWIGIDPGLDGGVAVLRHDGHLAAIRMPTFDYGSKRIVSGQFLADWLRTQGVGPQQAVEAAIEQVGARPGQGVTSMFGFGRSLGIVEGVLAALAVPTCHVQPRVWKKGTQTPADKDAARARATTAYPAHGHLWTHKVEDGVAEAALIALWCRRMTPLSDTARTP